MSKSKKVLIFKSVAKISISEEEFKALHKFTQEHKKMANNTPNNMFIWMVDENGNPASLINYNQIECII